jgi:4-hydroxybenzoate polyprenyltransferase/phosphoserine phosphatase
LLKTESYETVFVDLDGTILRTDLFAEAVLQLLRKNIFSIFKILFWVIQGRAYAKEKVAQAIDLDVAHLPFEQQLLEYLRYQKGLGKHVILLTASHFDYATRVAQYLDLFDEVIATQGSNNMKGPRKLAAIKARIGDLPFAYAGDSAADRPIWQAAASAVFVHAPARDIRAATSAAKPMLVIETRPPLWRAFLTGMRPHQYAKNALIFVPLAAAHGYQDPTLLLYAVLAFVCFSLCASGAYFLNDLLDLQSDRRHQSKCRRPLASGDLPLGVGVAGAVGLPLVSFGIALMYLPLLYVGVIGLYFVITSAYSLYLKTISTVDVMVLAVLYTLRIIAGAAATGIVLSSWLLGFSIFVFVSLAYLKRYIELTKLSNEAEMHGRGYSPQDIETMFTLGVANITASVVILSLYVNDAEVIETYKTPEALWLLCLLMLYWGNRIWVRARRGGIDGDPVVFAMKDRVSWMVGGLFMAIMVYARFIEIG